MTIFSISGIGMDSSITPLRHGGLSLVQTTDFFYPLVEDPYMQGVVLQYYFNCLSSKWNFNPILFHIRQESVVCERELD